MKQLILFTLIILTTKFAQGQENEIKKSFGNLKTIKIKDYSEGSFTFDSSSSKIYNSRFSDIKEKPKHFSGDDLACGERTIIIAELNLDKTKNKKVLITLGICPELEFYIQDMETKKNIGIFSAYNLIIPGNGTVYTSGHIGNFNVRQKFTLDKDSIIENKQPFYYVGLKSKTLRTVKIYSDRNMKSLLATIPKNYEIEILLTDSTFTPSQYLVRTSFGLTGWANLETGQYKSVDVEGLFYNND